MLCHGTRSLLFSWLTALLPIERAQKSGIPSPGFLAQRERTVL
jgi:hypothetical protein